MSNDIPLLDRLRTMGKSKWNPIGNEAADEIERLRDAMTGWEGYGWRGDKYHDSLQEYFDSVRKEQVHD